jgi:hypothetical protein
MWYEPGPSKALSTRGEGLGGGGNVQRQWRIEGRVADCGIIDPDTDWGHAEFIRNTVRTDGMCDWHP